MSIRFIAVVLCSAVGFFAWPAQAQVPQVINYQGRVIVGSTNFNGTGLFRFALVNTDGSTTYWSNDGTSSGGSQPTNAVSLTVTNGLYSVLLGDTSIPNMTSPIPVSVFTNPDVRLRVWFDDQLGDHSQQLMPDQRLAASGYALMAAGVDLPATTSATSGVLEIAGTPFLHAYGHGGLPDGNTFVGNNSGNFTLTGVSNAALGESTLPVNSTGMNNTAAGYAALSKNTAGSDNTVSGVSAMFSNTTAGQNVAIGSGAHKAQNYNNGGTSWNSNNVAVGYQALFADRSTATTNGINNTAVGTVALLRNTTGASNIALGYSAGSNLNTGSSNIDIGNYNPNTQTSSDVSGESNIIRIGDGATQTDTYLTGSVHATKVGIGIAASHGTLDVSGDTGAYTLGSTNAGFNGSSSGIAHFNAGTPASAIYANGGIVTTESFIAVSDARVKLVLGRSDAASDLDTLQAIAITDFRYKDVLAHGDATHKKVIAQQVEQVFPQAVSRRVGEVPDIYQRATIGADGWIELATDLKVGERVKLIGAQSQGVYEVRAVEATRFRADFQPAIDDDTVFVYGREVQDFRTVDYDAIAMLNVSATQELARQLATANQENAALKQRVADLESKNQERDAKLTAIEERLNSNPVANTR